MRVSADANGNPNRNAARFPTHGLSFTQWWPSSGPTACFPSTGSIVCARDQVVADAALPNESFGALSFANTAVVEPAVAWEQQKFLIAHTALNLPENQLAKWTDMMAVYDALHHNIEGVPDAARLEFHNPTGKRYFARSFGKETIFGKSVQRGIGARILEYANELLDKAYVTTKVTNGPNTWYVPVIASNGRPLVKFQGLDNGSGNRHASTTCRAIVPAGATVPTGGHVTFTTNLAFDSRANFGTSGSASLAEYEAAYAGCNVSSNQAAMALERYVSVPQFMTETLGQLGFIPFTGLKGVY